MKRMSVLCAFAAISAFLSTSCEATRHAATMMTEEMYNERRAAELYREQQFKMWCEYMEKVWAAQKEAKEQNKSENEKQTQSDENN